MYACFSVAAEVQATAIALTVRRAAPAKALAEQCNSRFVGPSRRVSCRHLIGNA